MDALYQKVVNNRELTPEEFMEVFGRDDAEELVLTGLLCGVDFSDYQDKFLKLPHPGDAMKIFILQGENLNDNLETAMFSQPDAEDVVAFFILHGKGLADKNAAKLFSLPSASVLVRLYILTGNTLSSENEAQLFDLPNAEELLELYILRGNRFKDDSDLKLMDVPYGQRLVSLCTRFGSLGTKAYFAAKEKGWV